jgi:type III secretion protein Q
MSSNDPLTAEPSPTESPEVRATVANAPIDIADMPVDIRFEAGRLQMRYGELCRLQPGYTCELGHTLAEQTIDIVANGALIARGELVSIGDQLGGRITALARDARDTG